MLKHCFERRRPHVCQNFLCKMAFSHSVNASGHLGTFYSHLDSRNMYFGEDYMCSHTTVFGSVSTQSENEVLENTMLFYVVLNMYVSRCCPPWSVQCCAGDNPQGLWARVCRVCVFSCVSPVLSCIFLCCLLLDSPPPCFSSLNNTSVRCSLRTRAREEERERDVGTPRKSKRETEKRGGRQGGKKRVLKDF